MGGKRERERERDPDDTIRGNNKSPTSELFFPCHLSHKSLQLVQRLYCVLYCKRKRWSSWLLEEVRSGTSWTCQDIHYFPGLRSLPQM